MSPSIRDLFGDEALDEEGGDAPFDPSNLTATLDAVLNDRPIAGAPADFVPSAPPLAPLPSDEAVQDPAAGGANPPTPEGAGPGVAPGPPTSTPPAAPPPPAAPATPFADLSDTELLELYEVRRALQDPERSVRIKQAYLGIDAGPAPIAAAPPAPPAPEPLPEHIDPGSFEAQLWTQNQEMRAQLAEIKTGLQAQGEQTQQQRELAAATNATQAFASKYGDRLSIDEIKAIAQLAGAQRLPAAFQAAGDTVEQSMDRSLEYVLRSNDVLLGKVLGAAPALPVLPGQQPEAEDRKRKLHALSSAASPAGEAPTREALTHREDGRLSEKSRLTVVQEMVNRMRGSDEGII